MQEHNPLLILIIASAVSHKIARDRGCALLLLLPDSHSWHTTDASPDVHIRLGSFIINPPPNMLITTANIKATLVKVLLHILNVLLRNSFGCTNECFFGACRGG